MHTIGPWFRLRLGLLFAGFLGFLALVGFRLVQLQVWVNPQLESLMARQSQSPSKRVALRVPIVDRNGEELAVSVPSGSVYVRPSQVKHRLKVAKRLAKWLGQDSKHWMEKLKSPKPFVWLQRQVPEVLAKEIAGAKLPGVFVESENKRIYPNENLAATTLGFTDIDGNGVSGLEFSLNDRLLPSDLRFIVNRDGKGTPTYVDRGYVRDAGVAPVVQATLDRRVQHIVEEELKRSIEEFEAKGGFAVVMNPHHGDLLALAQYPSFDPNRFSKFPSSSFNNLVISGLFEPGSTLKAIFAAEALHLGVLDPSSLIDCGDGVISVGGKKIREADAHHRFGNITLGQVIAYSSNVGAIRIGQALGADRLRFALDKFGLTSKTGVPLPGEAVSAAKIDSFWTPFALASASFGQGISATPLQVVAAFAPFANGGFWVKPRLLDASIDGEVRRRVISPAAAEAMKKILIAVTEDARGTGKLARIEGVRVAGKTGTAQKFAEDSGYSGGKYFTSFIGFLPADRPELLIGVMLDEPKNGYYATELAAPLFRRIAERSLSLLGLFPKKELAGLGTNAGAKPTRPAVIVAKSRMIERNSSGLLKVPDLKGLSVLEVLQLMGPELSAMQLHGNGYLDEQTPAPGTWVASDASVQLHFSPQG